MGGVQVVFLLYAKNAPGKALPCLYGHSESVSLHEAAPLEFSPIDLYPERLSVMDNFTKRITMSPKTLLIWLYLLLQALVFSTAVFSYIRQEQRTYATPLSIAKATGFLLHANLAVLILPTCDSVKWLLKRVWDIDAGTCTFIHKVTAWSIAVFATVHALTYWLVFVMLENGKPLPARAILRIGLMSGVGWSGHAMVLLISIKSASYVFPIRMSGVFELCKCRAVFWAVILPLWAAHESFGLPIKDVGLPQPTMAAFWPYWVVGGIVFIVERGINATRPKFRVWDKLDWSILQS